MKPFLKKSLVIFNILAIILPLNLIVYIQSAHADPVDSPAVSNDNQDQNPIEAIDSEGDQVGGIDVGINVPTINDNLPASVKSLMQFTSNNYLEGENGGIGGFLWATENISSSPKLVFNPSDLQDIRTLSCLGNVIPDFANHDDSLAAASGKTIADIATMKTADPTGYQNLITTAQNTARTNIVSNLKNDLPNFACIAGVDQNQAADMLKYDQTSVNAIIDNAQNKVVIDRRVLELLVNLVTPKDQGGAGHELIKVLRIRNGYNRDAKQTSRESTAIYQQIAQNTSSSKSSLTTVSDVSSADKNALSADPTIASATGQAEVIDSAGASQGDLVFSDAETASNLSAHYKGEAVDISAVDNIKCTLIKKKRIGSDDKTKLPATPISLAWQTSSGYDTSPPPDYSSLNANLRQLASGNYIDLLDQLGISVDSTTDLSKAGFSDIVGLIGKSLIGEMLNSPNMAISGTDFADTIKKIGGMALADDLNLPRQAFINANLADVNDLEAKIGEAQLEKKLNLPWGSIQGNNLNEILINTGERHVESALNLPTNTLSSSITDPTSLRLVIGRRTIENDLALPAGAFGTDTNFKKLETVAGQRKIDLVYQNPTSVDEKLGLGLNNYSAQYKSGALPPDAYATLVANKILADSVYSFASSTAAANAARLSVDSTSNSITTASANARMTDILAGTNLASNFQQIGADTLAQAFNGDSDVRAALVQWFNNKLTSSDCAVPSVATVTITIAGTTTTKVVTLPESQFMTTYGLSRGDFFRLFGCSNVNPQPVLKSLGQTALYNGIANSSAVKQAEASYLAQHPEITSALKTVDFYKTRIQLIQTKTAKIQSDWAGVTSSDANIGIFKTNIASAKSEVEKADTNGLSSGIQAISVTRNSAVNFDQASGALKNSVAANQSLKDKANTTALDFADIAQAVEEILTGKPQSSISSLQLSDLGSIGVQNTNDSTSASSGTQISAASLALMLAGKMTPENFLISIGANKIESSLDLPKNSIYYYATFIKNKTDSSNIDGQDAFFQSIGQAQLEETLHLPPNFFQGGTPGTLATLSDVRDHVSKVWGISSAEAGAQVMRALNLPADISSITGASSFASGSQVALAAGNLDTSLALPAGTSLKFLSGQSVSTDTLGSSDAELIAGRLNLPQNVIDTFTRVKTSAQSLTNGLNQNYANLITYNAHNGFTSQIASPTTTGSCPVGFSYTKQNGITFSVSSQIVDNSYVYADASGTHAFPSINEARSYAESNASSQVDFVKALSQGLASNPAVPNSFDAATAATYQSELNSFLSTPSKAAAFSSDELANISNKLNIPVTTLQNLFNRKDLLANLSQKPINPYLETIGKRTAESRITTAVFAGMGVTVAGMKIDASDIFDLLSGNGTLAVDKIGSKYLESQLGVGSNQVINIIQSTSSIIRNCSLANLGANFVGGMLGLGTVSLSGNIYENIGGAKIEKVLNLPSNSFRGSTLQELMDNIGPVAFARAFQLPPSEILTPDAITNLSLAASIAEQSIASQYQLAESHVNYPASTANIAPIALTNPALEKNITSTLNLAFNGSSADAFSTSNPTQSITLYQTTNFLNQVSGIDSQLGLPAGTTQQLLTSKITPDDYRHDVANTVIGLTPTGIDTWGKLLGIDSATLGKIDGFTNTFQRIKACGSKTIIGTSAATSCDYGAIFNNFSQVFGIDLDSKLGLSAGTIGRIITNPEQAAASLLLSGIEKLDNSLGLDPTAGASFTAAYIGLGGPLPYSDGWKTGLTTFRASDSIPTTGHFGAISISSSADRWEYYGQQIGEQLVGDYLSKIGIIATPSPGSGNYAGMPKTQDLILQSTNMLVHGDLRVLEITAAVKSAEALHIYNGSTTANLPAYFRITYEDIYYSIMGNPTLEKSYVDSATNNYLTNLNKANPIASVTETAEMAGSPATTLYASQCAPGSTAMGNTCYDPTNPTASSYSTYAAYDAASTGFAQDYPANPTVDPVAMMAAVQKNSQSIEDLNSVQEAARKQADTVTKNNLLWRMADAKLYQVDQNIPAGFVKTMYSGNGVQRTAMLMSYAKNALGTLSFNGVSYNKLDLGIDLYNSLTSFFQNPKGFDLDTMVKNGKMANLDSWIDGKLGNLLGFQLQPGTFTALAYGLKNGNFTADITIPGVGTPIKSLENIYKDWGISKITGWADKALGLPSGTAFTIYTTYREIVAANAAISSANMAVAGAADAATGGAAEAKNLVTANKQLADAKGNLSNVESAGIAFVVNLVFSKQIGQFETAVGLVPGTGSMLVSMLITGFNPISVAIFVLMNLFGVYKTEVTCTADGYYPGVDAKPDPSVSDNGNLGTFNGLDPTAKKSGYITAAQYKAKTLAGDVLALSERTGDALAIPSQIMTGRQEDVDYWQYKVDDVICSKVGGCSGSRAGLWVNPQTTNYTHIGF